MTSISSHGRRGHRAANIGKKSTEALIAASVRYETEVLQSWNPLETRVAGQETLGKP
jgi:hypothetical protein